ncbi:MAG: polymerase family protein [Microbacteriaceae bacterium]|nr:polymerase family protein [Microbacteriaceae bacterium]
MTRPETRAAARAQPVNRVMVLWCPDWPISAALLAYGLPRDAAIALVDRGEVFACSAAARREGVRRGLRLREAQARCTTLLVFPYDSGLDSRSFEPVLAAIEETMPGTQLIRPGTCVLMARGPARYYGGEEEAALWLLDRLDSINVHGSRIGIADGPFTAERAARQQKRQRIQIVPEGGSAAFLAPLPIGLLDQPSLVTLVMRLGIRTLGDFVALPAGAVRDRFGEDGARLHALAGGLDSRPVVPRVPPQELDSTVDFWPPLDRIDQVTFGFRASADRFIEGLVAAKLVCTALRIEVESEAGEISERGWLHPRSFTAADVVDRVRWQLQGGSGLSSSGLGSAITRVRVIPESVDSIGNHEDGLWGSGPDERVHHGLSRVQSMLGHGAVLTAVMGGGRTIADRQNLIAWGDTPVSTKPEAQPWPGRLPPPAPTTVFPIASQVSVTASSGEQVDLNDRGMLSGVPDRFSATNSLRDSRPVRAWAGPWPVDERWWDADTHRAASRFQLVDADGTAWLLLLEDHRWWAEARYD